MSRFRTCAEACETRIMLDGSPPVFDPSQFDFSVAEDQTVVGTVTVTDPDNDISGYSLSGTTDFEIDSNGKITATTMLDFEGQTTYQFDVIVEDAYSNTDTASVTVNVTDVAEDPVFDPPTGGGPWAFSISEMSHAGHLIGEMPLSDPQDDVSEIIVYEGFINDPDEWVAIDTFVASDEDGTAKFTVFDEWALDHESKLVWNLVLVAVDEYGNTGTTEVIVALSDEVEWGSAGTLIVSWEVEDPVLGIGTGHHHSELLIIPEDQATYGGQGALTQTVWVDRQEMFYATVGADKDDAILPKLVSEVNRKAIDEDKWSGGPLRRPAAPVT